VPRESQWYRREVLANNLANVSTAGFKQDGLTLKQGTIEAGREGPWRPAPTASPSGRTSKKPEPLRATSQRPFRLVERTLSAQLIQLSLANFLR
jgi:flagellar basal body rod protein FlgG